MILFLILLKPAEGSKTTFPLMGDGSVSSPSKFHRLCSEGTCLFSLFSPNYFQLQNCLLGETTFYLFIFSSCRTSGLPAPTSSHFWYFSPKLRSAGSLYLSLQYLCTCWDFSSALSPAVEVLQMEKKKKSIRCSLLICATMLFQCCPAYVWMRSNISYIRKIPGCK